MEELSKKIDCNSAEYCQSSRESRTRSRDVNLLAVTKTVGIDIARQAYDLGIRDFGENRTQELNRKQAALPQAAGI
jgi:uncharacterized pyridoxal phosphate-containing UPF0001 family protein